jgi:sphingosine kinase
MKVLVNPHSGPGYAEKWYHRDAEPLLNAAHCVIDMAKTTYRGEATEIAEHLDIEAFDVVAAVSGDGLPHEVFNGLGKRPDAKKALAKIAVVNIPGGSGNAMSWNLTGTGSPSLATLAIIKGIRTPLDLISITQGETRTLSFLSQSLGIVAESDLATEHMRWMGEMRFTVGFLTRLAKQVMFPCDLAIKVAIEDKSSIKAHYRSEVESHESESERRGYKHLLEDDASASSGNEDALPPLKYGTVNDKLPDGWDQVSYDNMGNFYSGNVSPLANLIFEVANFPSDGIYVSGRQLLPGCATQRRIHGPCHNRWGY